MCHFRLQTANQWFSSISRPSWVSSSSTLFHLLPVSLLLQKYSPVAGTTGVLAGPPCGTDAQPSTSSQYSPYSIFVTPSTGTGAKWHCEGQMGLAPKYSCNGCLLQREMVKDMIIYMQLYSIFSSFSFGTCLRHHLIIFICRPIHRTTN